MEGRQSNNAKLTRCRKLRGNSLFLALDAGEGNGPTWEPSSIVKYLKSAHTELK